jgi:pimeloyl-ACP methyl ester carboxylesterase
VIYCTGSLNPSEAHQRRTADKLKATWHVMDAGHYPMLSHPREMARLLLLEVDK